MGAIGANLGRGPGLGTGKRHFRKRERHVADYFEDRKLGLGIGAHGDRAVSEIAGGVSTLSDVRRRNEMLILGLLRREPGLSNAEIARNSGLAPQTVSVIVADLVLRGIVVSGPVVRGRRGQPATPKLLNAEAAFGIGIEVGWRHVDAVLINLEGRVIAEHGRSYAYPDPATIVDDLAGLIGKLRDTLPADRRQRIDGVGVAMPSRIWRGLFRLSAPEEAIEAWQHLDLGAALGRTSGYEVTIVNDGTAACQAEFIYGAARGWANCASFFLSSYVGTGLVVGNRLFEGPTGNSANLGSLLVTTRDGRVEYLHLVAGLEALDIARRRNGRSSLLMSSDADQWSGAEVDAWLEDAAHGLAFAIANSGAVVAFERVVVGGRMPVAVRNRLVEGIREHIAGLPRTTLVLPEIGPAALGWQAPALGAACTSFVRRYFGHEVQMV